jgi:hypothetical protein
MSLRRRKAPLSLGGRTLLLSAAVWISVTMLAPVQSAEQAVARALDYVVHDAHFHLTNYIQEGTNIRDFLKIMGDKVGRVALFGIPLQQPGPSPTRDFAPTYYLQSDAALLLLVHRRHIATQYRRCRRETRRASIR